jgi:hypothetical protein
MIHDQKNIKPHAKLKVGLFSARMMINTKF